MSEVSEEVMSDVRDTFRDKPMDLSSGTQRLAEALRVIAETRQGMEEFSYESDYARGFDEQRMKTCEAVVSQLGVSDGVMILKSTCWLSEAEGFLRKIPQLHYRFVETKNDRDFFVASYNKDMMSDVCYSL